MKYKKIRAQSTDNLTARYLYQVTQNNNRFNRGEVK
jgi:hypothetical protein